MTKTLWLEPSDDFIQELREDRRLGKNETYAFPHIGQSWRVVRGFPVAIGVVCGNLAKRPEFLCSSSTVEKLNFGGVLNFGGLAPGARGEAALQSRDAVSYCVMVHLGGAAMRQEPQRCHRLE
ncbi:hypothetical protein DPSP01_012802 [Paraphaeosphaeria sporulosa]